MRFNVTKSGTIGVVSVIIGILVGYLTFQNLHPENWMEKPTEVISLEDTKGTYRGYFIGCPAGDDIARLSGKEEFEALFSEYQYVTLEPKSIIATGVSGLKPWVNQYESTSRRVGASTRPKASITSSAWDFIDDYNEFYLLECPDGTYILAQLPLDYVNAIKKGEAVTLPVSYRKPLSSSAENALDKMLMDYDASREGYLYSFNDEWYSEHNMMIMTIRVITGIIVFFVVAVGLITLLEKVFHVKDGE